MMILEKPVMDDTMIGRWLSDLPMDDPTRKSTSKPMLRRFIHYDKPVRYLEFLGKGEEAVVYRVEILGNEYALKIFKHWEYQGDKDRVREKDQHYTFPISHEARAFARLDSVGLNGTWAVKCHGWMKITGARPRGAHMYSEWAIVKDYLPNPVSIEDVPEIRRKMSIARKALIHPVDTEPRNYRGSFLVDLGHCRTWPYPKRLWRNQKWKEFFTWFDKCASEWAVSVRDGTVIDGWLNDHFKEAIANAEAMKKEEAEKERAKRQARVLHRSVKEEVKNENEATIDPTCSGQTKACADSRDEFPQPKLITAPEYQAV